MKTPKYILTTLVALTIPFLMALTACSAAVAAPPQAQPGTGSVRTASGSPARSTADTDITTVDDQGNRSIDSSSLQASLASLSDLSDDEIAGLLYMREEEKLAHDVYIALYETWGLRIFQNIANSEQTHTDAVNVLLDAYGLEDPAAGKAPGEFVDADLQALYNELTAQGSQSLSDALRIGAVIEEIDILDLETRLAQTENTDIRLTYENLMKGSRNHLRSFTSTLSRQTGETYQPQYLSPDVYQGIVNSAMETGGNGKGK
jgi:hypothetical protein